MDAIYTASQSVRLLHRVAGWAGHTWGRLPEDDVINAVLRAADRGEFTPEGIQAAIIAACEARLTPGVMGWGICCPDANPGGDNPDVLAVPIGSAVVVHVRITDARGQYTYWYNTDGYYAVRFALEDYGYWRVYQSFATSGTARKRDIFRAGVILAQAGIHMPACDDNLRQAVAEEYNWPELATRALTDIGPGILAAPG
ncbi:MAG: hypothetical protein KatS3mg023_3791 [Armatimonadota bacterium]|nr:MAG: hypothetical protein KatS3mg023_3791 [Armatimonadota bacterium]